MIIVIFDDYKSFFHLLIGALTPLLGTWGLFVFVVYLLYQHFDKDSPEEKIGDIVEYLIGVGGCYIVLEAAGLF